MPQGSRAYLPLESLGEDGSIPRSRLNDAQAVSEIVQRLIEANQKRSETDAEVTGLISGNPPYSQRLLEKHAQSWRTNFASRIGEAAFNLALSQFNDVILESNPLAEVKTSHGSDQEKDDWSGIITEEFHRLNQRDDKLVYNLFLSQHDMVLYRCGPLVFEHPFDHRFKAVPQRYVLVPDETLSDVSEWPLGVIRSFYRADQLYSFIRDEPTARKAGWRVAEVRKALMNKVPMSAWPRNRRYDWEWYEQRLRNNDLYWGTTMESIPVSHVYYREFARNGEVEGKISKCSVMEDYEKGKFLFRKTHCYSKWQEFVHPFYYDRGDGTHHSVKGYGIKGYGAWAAYDRLNCHVIDSAFIAGSMHFQAATPNDLQNLAVTTMGPYMWHPPGGTYLQTQSLGAVLEGPMAVKQDLVSTVTQNLAQYRQQVANIKRDRVTGREIDYHADEEAMIGKSQMTRYFEQLDGLWAERFRRAANPDLRLFYPGAGEAMEFQQRCRMRGVPQEALEKIESVRACRTVGNGSVNARRQALDRMYSRLPTYSEEGRERVLEDLDSIDVGYTNMCRYRSKRKASVGELEQVADATDKVSSIKTGVPPVIAPSQNPVVYARTWLAAADEAAGTLAKTNGQSMQSVYSFLEIAGPAIHQQLERFKNDQTRKSDYEKMSAQWKQLAGLHDKLGAKLKQQAQMQAKRQQQLAQQQQKVNGELAIKAKETEAKTQISAWKAQKNMQLREQVHRQNLVIKDATTASDIRNKRLKSLSE